MLRQRHLLLAVIVPVLMLSGVVGMALAVSAGWAQIARPTLAMFRGSDPSATETDKAVSPVVKAAAVPAKQEQSVAPQPPKLGLDIARIDPDGTSVFAGLAKSSSKVTVYADGIAIGTVTSDDNGEWVFITEHKFATPTPLITLKYGTPRVDVAALETSAKLPAEQVTPRPVAANVAVAAPKSTAARSSKATPTPTVRDVTDGMLHHLKTLTDKARVEARPSSEPVRSVEAVPTPAPGSEAKLGKTSVVVKAAPIVPVPIKFVYRSDRFSKSGRKAADLLLTYLVEKSPGRVVLTGHADERGTAPANMWLSKRRLAALARFLRKGGFKGDLVLLPRGETEKFAGVDRSRYSQEELWELDRRVEVQTIQ